MIFSVFNCGGSLIDNNHLLTAAHCLNTLSIFKLVMQIQHFHLK